MRPHFEQTALSVPYRKLWFLQYVGDAVKPVPSAAFGVLGSISAKDMTLRSPLAGSQQHMLVELMMVA